MSSTFQLTLILTSFSCRFSISLVWGTFFHFPEGQDLDSLMSFGYLSSDNAPFNMKVLPHSSLVMLEGNLYFPNKRGGCLTRPCEPNKPQGYNLNRL